MFAASSVQMDLLNENFFVSLTRDAISGSLDLEAVPTMMPLKLHNIVGEFDFPGAAAPVLPAPSKG